VKALDRSVDASIPRQRYAETLAGRIQEVEHQIYQDAAARVLGGDWAIDGRRFVGARR
jgi:folate-dependent phosphoribosylglycinamide formyltransferase PurN